MKDGCTSRIRFAAWSSASLFLGACSNLGGFFLHHSANWRSSSVLARTSCLTARAGARRGCSSHTATQQIYCQQRAYLLTRASPAAASWF